MTYPDVVMIRVGPLSFSQNRRGTPPMPHERLP
jgi:hypothetical protein